MFPVQLPAGVGLWFQRHGGRGPGGGRAAAEAQGEPQPLPEAHAAVDREGAGPPASGMEGKGGGRDRGAEGRVGVGDRGVGWGLLRGSIDLQPRAGAFSARVRGSSPPSI